jgi:uncharacterized protein GlcG (DUF336 family)
MKVADARRILEACRVKADEIGKPVSVAVLDASSTMLIFERMNDSAPFTAFLAECKASGSAISGMPSGTLADLAERRPALVAKLSERLNGRFVAVQGAVPLRQDGIIVGAVGVSGATSEEDEQIALAGAAVL